MIKNYESELKKAKVEANKVEEESIPDPVAEPVAKEEVQTEVKEVKTEKDSTPEKEEKEEDDDTMFSPFYHV